MDQRVQDFAEKFTDELIVLDQADFDLQAIPEVARHYLAAILTGVCYSADGRSDCF